MNQQINNTIAATIRGPRQAWPLKASLLPLVLGIGLLGPAPAVLAADECGSGPVVTCTAGNHTGGITYDFSTDLSITTIGNVGVGGAGFGMRLTGSGNAGVQLQFQNPVYGVGGVHVLLDNGNLDGDIRHNLMNTVSINDRNVGTGLHVSTGGAANLRLHGNRASGVTPYRLGNLVMDIGSDSRVWVDYRRTVITSDLSPRAGATLVIDNDGGILGVENIARLSAEIAVRGSGAGHLVLNNALVQGRISGRMDFTGMTGQLTILNDYSGHSRAGGWHTMGTSLFGSGDVEIHNGPRGVLRTATEAVLDFSDTRSAQFFNQGRVMVGATDINNHQVPDQHLRFIGLDRFENAGVILLGTDFDVTTDTGDVTAGKTRDRLTFEDSHYVGAGGSIAFDALLARESQSDCSTTALSDCVQFTGSSTTEGTTLVTIRDMDPRTEVAGFNPGIVLIEGASAAEHFVLDPASLYYVGHTSQGRAVQKGLVAYHLRYDANTRKHALVGTLADEAMQATLLGMAGQETWHSSTDTWFDRIEARRDQGEDGFDSRGLWVTMNTLAVERSGSAQFEHGGVSTVYRLDQDQTVSHLAFGIDLLRGSMDDQRWHAGVTAGLLYSSVDYAATRTETTMAGMASGVYGSWAMGALSVDGMLNLNFMRQSVDGSNFGLGEHARLRTQVRSFGGRIDAAWTLPVSDSVWIQPLLGLSYVTVSEEDLHLADGSGSINFTSSPASLRLGAGLRAGFDSRLAGLRAQYHLTGRYWNERDGESQVAVYIGGEYQPLVMMSQVSGGLGEVGASLSLSNESGLLSGYLDLKTRFADGYDSVGGSLGLRYAW